MPVLKADDRTCYSANRTCDEELEQRQHDRAKEVEALAVCAPAVIAEEHSHAADVLEVEIPHVWEQVAPSEVHDKEGIEHLPAPGIVSVQPLQAEFELFPADSVRRTHPPFASGRTGRSRRPSHRPCSLPTWVWQPSKTR